MHVCVCVLACVCLSICVCMCTCVRATNKRSKVEKFGVHRFESPPRRPVTDQSPSRRAQSPDRRNPESPARGGRAPSHHDHAGRDASPVRSGHGGRRSSSPDIGHRSSSPTAGARRPSIHHGMQALALVGMAVPARAHVNAKEIVRMRTVQTRGNGNGAKSNQKILP